MTGRRPGCEDGGRAVRHATALVIAACSEGDVAGLPDADVVVAADSGVDVALRFRRKVDVLVGDLDSASPAGLEWARSHGARVDRHPRRKDATDIELALSAAAELAASVHVVASVGGRLDHALANLTLLASPRWAAVELSAAIGSARVDVVRRRHRIGGAAGELVSLLAVGGPARGVRTSGLEYPLDGEDLEPCTTRGVSNVICAPPAEVEVSSGALLAVRPAP